MKSKAIFDIAYACAWKHHIQQVHNEMYLHGFPQLNGAVINGPCMTLSPEENDDDEDLRDYHEFKWVEQYLGCITYYCMIESSAHLPEKYWRNDDGNGNPKNKYGDW